MLTAKAQDADLFNGYRRGADCYLTKPFNPKELNQFVERIFDSFEKELDGERPPYDLG
jgi:two-component system alkaline phosphatase synthesis response regulator PhoP/two-component system response regulator VicR